MPTRGTLIGWFAAILSIAAPVIASAQDVLITTPRSGFKIFGQMIEYDDDSFLIRSNMGQLRIPREGTTCVGTGCPGPEVMDGAVDIASSAALGGLLLPELLQGYAARQGASMKVEFDAGSGVMMSDLRMADGAQGPQMNMSLTSSGEAISALLNGRASILLTSRRISDAEAALFEAAGQPDIRTPERESVIALDGVTVVTSPENPVRSLTLDQIGAMMAGRIRNWNSVGGPNAPVRVLVPDGSDEISSAFDRDVLRPRRLRIGARVDRSLPLGAIGDEVARDPTAIGLTTIAFSGAARPVEIVQSCGLIAAAEPFAVKAEEYPLTRRVYVYTSGEGMNPAARSFVRFLLSEPAQEIIARQGFVDQTIRVQDQLTIDRRFVRALVETSSPEALGQLHQFAAGVHGAVRLSATLRFNSGSSDLDRKADQDVDRIVRMAREGELAGREVVLLGFTDDVGRGDINAILAERRVNVVRDTLLERLNRPGMDERVQAIAYGPISPVGCNSDPQGRAANRRVEVWLRDMK